MLPSTCPSWPLCTRAYSHPGANVSRHYCTSSSSHSHLFFSFFAFSQLVLNFQNPSRSTCFTPNEYRHKMVYPKVIDSHYTSPRMHTYAWEMQRGICGPRRWSWHSPVPSSPRIRPLLHLLGQPLAVLHPISGPHSVGSSQQHLTPLYTTSLSCTLFHILNSKVNNFKTIKTKYK